MPLPNIAYAGVIQYLRKAQETARATLFARMRGLHRAPPVYIDVGARGGLSKKWKAMYRTGLVIPVLFKPDPDEAERLSVSLPSAVIIKAALGEENSIRDLYITRAPGCSSLLVPNIDVMKTYGKEGDFEVQRTIPVKVSTMDDYEHSMPSPDFLKIDVQGFYLHVLRGATSTLRRILAIEVETQLVSVYQNQALFHELYSFLRSVGFGLVAFRPLGLAAGQIIEANAFFTRPPQSEIERDKLQMWSILMGIPSSSEYSTMSG